MSKWSISRINSLLELAEKRNYLEIGVEHGNTFFAIEADLKVAVDPAFRFDFKSRSNPTEMFFQSTSDLFFSQIQDEAFLFDVIFLDGLHNFSQTYSDLMNALNVLSPSGYILIDDVFPSDEFSFMPIQSDAYSERAKSIAPARLMDFSWHGDVFKVISLIHDYHQELHYRTFWDLDSNPQTVVWFDYPENRIRRFGGIEFISNLKYKDVLLNQDILHSCTYFEIMDTLRNLKST